MSIKNVAIDRVATRCSALTSKLNFYSPDQVWTPRRIARKLKLARRTNGGSPLVFSLALFTNCEITPYIALKIFLFPAMPLLVSPRAVRVLLSRAHSAALSTTSQAALEKQFRHAVEKHLPADGRGVVGFSMKRVSRQRQRETRIARACACVPQRDYCVVTRRCSAFVARMKHQGESANAPPFRPRTRVFLFRTFLSQTNAAHLFCSPCARMARSNQIPITTPSHHHNTRSQSAYHCICAPVPLSTTAALSLTLPCPQTFATAWHHRRAAAPLLPFAAGGHEPARRRHAAPLR